MYSTTIIIMNPIYTYFIQTLILFCQNNSKTPTLLNPSWKSRPASAYINTPRIFKDSTYPVMDDNHVNAYPREHDMEDYSSRRKFLLSALVLMAKPDVGHTAPPISIIAEELGYFPVTNQAGDTIYIPSKITRSSTPQSIALAKHLQQVGAVMVGAYWCPHCRHQKQLFGKEAWSYIEYVEGSPKGYGYDPKLLFSKTKQTSIEGFPTWIFTKLQGEDKILVGEAPLKKLAQATHYRGSFDETLEPIDVSATVGSCK